MTRRRVQRLLALSPAEAELLTSRAHARLGRRGYLLRIATFTIATAPLLRRAIPGGIRRRAIRPLLHGLLPGSSENLLYATFPPAPLDRAAGR